MSRIPPNHSVRRRLFESTVEDEARNDNVSNNLREEHDREYEEQSRKYHYDFRNDRPLHGEGPYQWFNENDRLIGVSQGEATVFEEGAEKFNDVYRFNQTTKEDECSGSKENDRNNNDNVLNGDANGLVANESNILGIGPNEADRNEEKDDTVNTNATATPIKVKPSNNNPQ